MAYPVKLTSDYAPEEQALLAVRSACQWHVVPEVDDELTVDGNGTTRIALPTKRIVQVTAVIVNGRTLPATAYSWSQDGWITRRDGGLWPDVERSVTISLRHGFDYAPEVDQIVEALTQRLAMAPSGIERSVAVGPFRDDYVVGSRGITTAGLLETEQAALARYRLEGVSRV